MRAVALFGDQEVPITSLNYDRSSIEVDRPPAASLTMEGPATWFEMLQEGTEVTVKRSGATIFPGVVDRRVRRREAEGGIRADVHLVHKGYLLWRNQVCVGYDYAEDGAGPRTRDGRHVNPWRRIVFNKPIPPTLATLAETPVDWVRRDEHVQTLVGTKAIWQMDFRDQRWLRADQVRQNTNDQEFLPASPIDRSGNALDLAENGGVVGRADSVPGRVGYDLDGVDDYLSSADTSLRLLGDMSLTARFRLDDLDQDMVILDSANDEAGGGHINYRLMVLTDGTLRYVHNSGASQEVLDSAPGVVTAGAFMQVSMRRDTVGKTVDAWVGTTKVINAASYTTNPISGTGTYRFRLGSSATAAAAGDPMDGIMEEVRLWSKTNTPTLLNDIALGNANGFPFEAEGSELALWFLASTTRPMVYQFGDEARPSLQRIRGPNGYRKAAPIETIPLMNGDPDLVPMGTVSTVRVLLIGVLDGTEHPLVRVCRNAGESTRMFTEVTLTHTPNYLSTGLDAWTGTVDLSADGATQKNQVGLEIESPGDEGSADTTRIYYGRADADTVSDTGLSEGTIDVFTHPSGVDSDAAIVDDHEGLKRIDAAERTRRASPTTTAAHPVWDLHIDSDLAVHFTEDRGTDRTATVVLTPESEGVRGWEEDEDGTQLAYQTVIQLGGQGGAHQVVVDKTEHADGGLYDAALDPAVGAQHGVLPGILLLRDGSVGSRGEAFALAFGRHRLHRSSQVQLRIDLHASNVDLFGVGDRIRVLDPQLGIDSSVRVVALSSVEDGGGGETLAVEVGDRLDPPEQALRRQNALRDQTSLAHQEKQASAGSQGTVVHLQAARPTRFQFPIPVGADVERVEVFLRSLAYEVGTSTGPFRLEDMAGDPIFPQDVELAIDPAEADSFMEDNFIINKKRITFGDESASRTLRLDATPDLRVADPEQASLDEVKKNGIILSGLHDIYMQGRSTAANPDGLASVAVGVNLIRREDAQ